VKKLTYLGEEFFLASSSSHPFCLIFLFLGFYYLCDSFYLCATREEVFLFDCTCYFGNNERLGKIVWIFFEVNSFVFHAWLECPNISCFWSRGG